LSIIPNRLVVALVAGLFACLSQAPAVGGDYGSGYRFAPSSGGQQSYYPPSASGSQGYGPAYDDRAYGPQAHGAGPYGDPTAGQGGAAVPWSFAPGGRSPSGGVGGYQFRERPEDKRLDHDAYPRFRPDPDLARRSRGFWSPTGESWSAPGSQPPAVIFRPLDSGSEKPKGAAERSPDYPAWGDPGLGVPPWPGGGAGYYPPPY
jgi:hypothetical protein